MTEVTLKQATSLARCSNRLDTVAGILASSPLAAIQIKEKEDRMEAKNNLKNNNNM